MYREFLHAGLVAQYRALGALAAGVDGQHGQLVGGVAVEQVGAEDVDRGALAGAGHAGDAYAAALARIGQALFDHFLGHGLLLGQQALDQGHCLPQDGGVALAQALDIVGGRELRPVLAGFQVGVDHGWLLDACVHLQAAVAGLVLGVLDLWILVGVLDDFCCAHFDC